MGSGIAEVHIVGRAGRDAERKGDRGPVKFSLATGGGRKRDSEEKWPTHWHTVIAWGDLRDEAILVTKGQEVEVWGRLEYNDWTDNQGAKRRDAQVVLTKIANGSTPPNSDRHDFARQETRGEVTHPDSMIEDSEIPF